MSENELLRNIWCAWSNGQATYFSSDEAAFAAGVDYVFQTNSWSNTYYGSYEATIVGYAALTRTGQLLAPQSVHQALNIFRSAGSQENIFQKVNRKFGGDLATPKDKAHSKFMLYRMEIASPPRYTTKYNAFELKDYYCEYLILNFQDKIFYDDDKEFDIRAVGFDIYIDWPDGTSERFSSEFVPIDPLLGPIFINPGNISDTGLGTPIQNHIESDGATVGIMVLFQTTFVH